MNWPQVFMCPPPILKPLLPPSLPYPWAVPVCPASHIELVYWSSILHLGMYMFQCYSLKSSHPLPIPRSPKVCPLHLCLLFCPACRIIRAVFLNSIWRRRGEKGTFLYYGGKTNWYSHYGEQCRDSLKNWK